MAGREVARTPLGPKAGSWPASYPGSLQPGQRGTEQTLTAGAGRERGPEGEGRERLHPQEGSPAAEMGRVLGGAELPAARVRQRLLHGRSSRTCG